MNGVEYRPTVLGTVTDYVALRAAIDAHPNLFSARLSADYHAIMVELNQHLPEGRMVSIADVHKAMMLRPVPQPTGAVKATGRAIGKGLTGQ